MSYSIGGGRLYHSLSNRVLIFLAKITLLNLSSQLQIIQKVAEGNLSS